MTEEKKKVNFAGSQFLSMEMLPVIKTPASTQSSRNYPSCNGRNALKTVASYVTFLGAGMGNALYGATIIQLEKQTNSTTRQIAPIFMWRFLGALGGNFIIAFLFNRVPPEVVLAVGCLGLGVMNFCIPFCHNFIMLMAVTVVHGVSHGIVGGGCNSYMVKTWRMKATTIIHGLHFLTSFGSTVTPMIVNLYFQNQSDHAYHNNTIFNGSIHYNDSLLDDYGKGFVYINSTMDDVTVVEEGTIDIFVPYAIAGAVEITAAILYMTSLIVDVLSFKKTLNREDSFLNQQKEDSEPLKSKPLFALMLVFVAIYCGLESAYGAWILAFEVKYMEVSFQTAALITTSYWGALAVGRALGIVTSRLFSPNVLISINITFAAIALAVFTAACDVHVAVSWACTILAGLSFASVFGNSIAFCIHELNMTGTTASFQGIFCYIGYMTLPALVGVLFANFTPMYFAYVLLIAAVSLILIFFPVVFYINKCLNKRLYTPAERKELDAKK